MAAPDTTPTPRTDEACEAMGLKAFVVPVETGRQLEREFTEKTNEVARLREEISQIRNALGDDGRRTNKEILELASKASHWRDWKQKYIDLKNAHIAEGQDPAGTIWEHADKLQGELKSSQSEVARLRELLNRAIEIADDAITPLQRSEYSMDGDMLYRQLERLRDDIARLAPAPEEPNK